MDADCIPLGYPPAGAAGEPVANPPPAATGGFAGNPPEAGDGGPAGKPPKAEGDVSACAGRDERVKRGASKGLFCWL
nr:hypothetical protein Ade03nite_12050 [Actinoplanes derwentensis]